MYRCVINNRVHEFFGVTRYKYIIDATPRQATAFAGVLRVYRIIRVFSAGTSAAVDSMIYSLCELAKYSDLAGRAGFDFGRVAASERVRFGTFFVSEFRRTMLAKIAYTISSELGESLDEF